MAARMRRRTFVRQNRRFLWTVLSFNTTFNDTAHTNTLVSAADWTGAAGLERATYYGSRGYFTVYGPSAVREQQAWAGYIGKFDEDEAAPSPATSATYIDEQILATYGDAWFSGDSVTTAVEVPRSHVVVDIKARRVITSGDSIKMAFIERVTTTGSYTLTGVIRSLIRLDTH